MLFFLGGGGAETLLDTTTAEPKWGKPVKEFYSAFGSGEDTVIQLWLTMKEIGEFI